MKKIEYIKYTKKKSSSYICLFYCFLYVCGEEEVLAPTCRHHVLKSWLVYGEVSRVPCCDPLRRLVHNSDRDVWALLGYDAAGWAPNIPCTKAADLANAPTVHFNLKLINNVSFYIDLTQMYFLISFISSLIKFAQPFNKIGQTWIFYDCNTTPVVDNFY